ncbi:MAG: hypothetical protein WKF99_05280, partial [Solirubrobacteraceae bacterium]
PGRGAAGADGHRRVVHAPSVGSTRRWPAFLVALLATAAFIELRALDQGRWSYAESMPTVFTMGLSPLVQLALTGTLAVLIAWRAGGPARPR